MSKAPLLNGSKVPLEFLVPSGKMRMFFCGIEYYNIFGKIVGHFTFLTVKIWTLLEITCLAENRPSDFLRDTKMLSQKNAGMLKKGFQIKEAFIKPEKFPEATRIFLFAENLWVDKIIFNP
jgi:hypothetical protein